MKIRLVGGPFSGKVIKDWRGDPVCRMRGPKPMSRKQRVEFQIDHYSSGNYFWNQPHIPTVTAHYQKATVWENINGQIVQIPCMHPDGSYFYNYVKPSKRN
jgi:hypothetical protein